MKRKALSLLVLVFMICMMASTSAFAATKLAKPTITALKKYTDTSVQLKWKKVNGATKYYVYSSTDGKKYKKIATTANLKYTHKKLKTGKTYYYKIKAGNKSVISKYSKVKNIKLPVMPSSITVKPTTIKLGVGETISLDKFTVKVGPTNAADKSVTFYSSNTKVLAVNSAKRTMTGKKEGTAYLVAETTNGIKGKVKVIVVKTTKTVYREYLEKHEQDGEYSDYSSEFNLLSIGAKCPVLGYFASGYDVNYDNGYNEITRLLYFNPDYDKDIRVLMDDREYTDYDSDIEMIYVEDEHRYYFIKDKSLICIYSRLREESSDTTTESYIVVGVDDSPIRGETIEIQKDARYDEDDREIPGSTTYKFKNSAAMRKLDYTGGTESFIEYLRSGKEFGLSKERYKNTEENRSKVLG